MSIEEKDLPEDKGPHKFSKKEIQEQFENDFEIDSIKKTVFQGTLNPLPIAWFVVMKKKD